MEIKNFKKEFNIPKRKTIVFFDDLSKNIAVIIPDKMKRKSLQNWINRNYLSFTKVKDEVLKDKKTRSLELN